MSHCPACGARNTEGELFCAQCGGSLTTEPLTPWLSRSGHLSDAVGQLERGTPLFDDGDYLVIHIRDHPTPILAALHDQVVLGRSDARSGAAPDLDLVAYRAAEGGVSRLHAVIRRTGRSLTLEDLGSRNGTQLNGQKLPPCEPHPLHDGDVVRLGALILHIYFSQGRAE